MLLYGIGSVPSETLHLLMVQSHDRIHELNEPVEGIFASATTFSNVKVCLMLLKRQLLYSIRRFNSGHEMSRRTLTHTKLSFRTMCR